MKRRGFFAAVIGGAVGAKLAPPVETLFGYPIIYGIHPTLPVIRGLDLSPTESFSIAWRMLPTGPEIVEASLLDLFDGPMQQLQRRLREQAVPELIHEMALSEDAAFLKKGGKRGA